MERLEDASPTLSLILWRGDALKSMVHGPNRVQGIQSRTFMLADLSRSKDLELQFSGQQKTPEC